METYLRKLFGIKHDSIAPGISINDDDIQVLFEYICSCCDYDPARQTQEKRKVDDESKAEHTAYFVDFLQIQAPTLKSILYQYFD